MLHNEDVNLNDKTASSTNPEKTTPQPTATTPQPNVQISQINNTEAIKNSFENLRVPLQVDISLTQENEMRGEMNYEMSEEMILAFRDRQSEIMREQLTILELGMDDTVQITEKTDSPQTHQTNTLSNRK